MMPTYKIKWICVNKHFVILDATAFVVAFRAFEAVDKLKASLPAVIAESLVVISWEELDSRNMGNHIPYET